jgi:hypothetical protein
VARACEKDAALWTDIREKLLALDLDFAKLKVYQDGLPVCGQELEIARKLAEEESPNYKLVIELVERGAQLIGTEDPQLLLEEYTLVQAGSGQSKKPTMKPEQIIARRDEFIARRIDQTLKPGETAVLFIGAFHKVNERLAKDIEVRYLK